MKWMLDTDACITLIRQQSAKLLRQLRAHPVGEVGVSALTVAELFFGVEKSAHPARNRSALEQFLMPLEIAPFNPEASKRYGVVRADLERRGQAIGAIDTLIAAQALSLNATVVTHNRRDFSRVAGLRVEDWAAQGG